MTTRRLFWLVLALVLAWDLANWPPQPAPHGQARAQGTIPVQQAPQRLEAATQASYSRTASATITITGTAGFYIVIDAIDIMNCAGATQVTGAAPTYITTTGLTGSPQFQVGSGGGAAGGQCVPVPMPALGPGGLKASTPGTNVTFVLPAFATNQTVSVNVYSHLVPGP